MLWLIAHACTCVLSLPLLPVCHWLIWGVLSSCPWELPLRLLVRWSPALYPLSLSLSGSSLHEGQTSRWFPAGIHFLSHSYFHCTVITLNHSPLSLKTYSALRPRDCSQKLPVQTKRHISCEEFVFIVSDLHELNRWIGEQTYCFIYTYFPNIPCMHNEQKDGENSL